MKDLITKLEAAETGRYELDAEIAVRTWFPEYVYPNEVMNRKPDSWGEAWIRLTADGFGIGGAQLSNYTTSLDAALTLVPEGWGKVVGEDNTGMGYAYLAPSLSEPDIPYIGTFGWRRAATPALALCIAALKARQT